MEDGRLIKRFLLQLQYSKRIWCSWIENPYLKLLGINHVFLNLLILNIKVIKRKLFGITETLWLTTFAKLRTYTKFRNEYKIKPLDLSPTLSKQLLPILTLDVDPFPYWSKLVAFVINNCFNGFASFVKVIVLSTRNTSSYNIHHIHILKGKYFHLFGSEHFANNQYLHFTWNARPKSIRRF